MRISSRLPFRRVAVVLAGGGAFAAYEVGVLRALRRLGLKPRIIAAVSAGAMNAVSWLAHGDDPGPLEQAWATLRPAAVGIRWSMLGLRAFGSFLLVFGFLQAVILLAGLPETAVQQRFTDIRQLGGYVRVTAALEFVSWVIVAAIGMGVVWLSRPIEAMLGRWLSARTQRHLHRVAGAAIVAGALLYVVVLVFRVPWPVRVHSVALVILTILWLSNAPGPVRRGLGPLWLRLMPETGGRGLWSNSARRQLLKGIVARGRASELTRPDVLLILSACDVATGRITYFVNHEPDSEHFEATMRADASDVVVLRKPREIVEAAVASSAVPVLYEPVRFHGRLLLDGGLFANHPLLAATAAGADAILLVIVAPSAGIRPARPDANLVEIAGRLSEIANWRDLQSELRRMPDRFHREGEFARMCVVEPEAPFEGNMFDFNADRAPELIERGERDGLHALVRAGWLETDDGEAATP